MASTDAKIFPEKNIAYRVTFAIYDADGDLVTGATALDSEVSKDGGTFADCTNEATEIATASGMYFLDLTATEMNADTVAIIVKTTSSGAKTTAMVMYPTSTGDIKADVDSISQDSFAADRLEAWMDGIRTATAQAGASGSITLDVSASAVNDFYNGFMVMLVGSTGAGQSPRLITDYDGTTKVATISPNWITNPDGTTTFVLFPSAQVEANIKSKDATLALSIQEKKDVAREVIDYVHNSDTQITSTEGGKLRVKTSKIGTVGSSLGQRDMTNVFDGNGVIDTIATP